MSPALAACKDASQGWFYWDTFKALLAKIREAVGHARIRRPVRSFFNMQLQIPAETTTTILQRVAVIAFGRLQSRRSQVQASAVPLNRVVVFPPIQMVPLVSGVMVMRPVRPSVVPWEMV